MGNGIVELSFDQLRGYLVFWGVPLNKTIKTSNRFRPPVCFLGKELGVFFDRRYIFD